MFAFYKNFNSVEKQAFTIGTIVTFSLHIALIVAMVVSRGEKEGDKKIVKNVIEAKLLKKGSKKKFGKKAKYLPDKVDQASDNKKVKKVEKKVVKTKKVEKKVVKKEVVKKSSADTINLSKKLKNIEKKIEKKKGNRKKSSLKDLNSLTNRISNKIDKRSTQIGDPDSKSGDIGDPDGVDGGTETDPSQTIQGSLYGNRVAKSLRKAWKMPAISKGEMNKLLVVTHIYIDIDGSIVKYKILKKSSNRIYNQSVINLLKRVKKVIAPPKQFKDYYKKNGMKVNFIPKR